MKRFLAALTLTCVLAGPALAGHIDTCGSPAPPPPGATEDVTAPGEIPSTGYTSPGDMPTCGLSVVLTVLDLVF